MQPVHHLLVAVRGNDGASQLEQPVGERRFAVVNVRDDREVPDPLCGAACRAPPWGAVAKEIVAKEAVGGRVTSSMHAGERVECS